MSTQYDNLAVAIIKHQQEIVGPLAWSEAEKVSGLTIQDHAVTISGDGKKVLEKLVAQYENLFGQASVEACKDAVRPLVTKLKNVDIPKILL